MLILGAGPIGVLCLAVAKQWGASTAVSVDISATRLEVAKKYGANATYMPPQKDANLDPLEHAEAVAEEIKRLYPNRAGPDVVLECSGAEPCIQMGVFAAKKGGTMTQAGMGKEGVTFPITALCTKGLSLKGSIRYRPGNYAAAIELISSGRLQVKELVTNRFAFEQAEAAFELVKSGRADVFKVMIAGPE